MSLRRLIAPAAAVVLGLAAAPASAPAAPAPAAAGACAVKASYSGLTILSSRAVPAGPAVPAHCEATGVIRPEPGSEIGVVFRMPENWNGKVLGLGGGGWAGNVRPETAAAGLAKGYATLQTDAGHASPEGNNADWSLSAPGKANQPGLTDFSWRAIHLMTVAGKQTVRDYYGRDPARAYFQGCSTGGRQGLMEAQRFPDDYDGVIAGAPVYDLVVQTSALVRTQIFHKAAGSNLTAAQVPLINQAVLKACDAQDGAVDGIIGDPRTCRWDPRALACPSTSAGADCLSPAQLATVRKAYAGLKLPDGRWVSYPLMRGGELEWLPRSVGSPQNPLGSNFTTGARAIQYFIYADPNYDLNGWDPATEMTKVRGGAFAKDYEAGKTDIGAFTRRGGKLILWHGLYDPGPSPLGTIAYYQGVARAGAGASERLFLVPGVYHCVGGPGPDRFDMIEALEAWVERGAAPERVIATNPRSGLSRPLCPYPALPNYRDGDVKSEASFTCAAPTISSAANGRAPPRRPRL